MSVLQGLCATPSAFNKQLMAAWKGEPNDNRLFYSLFNGTAWSAAGTIPGASSTGPSLATYNGAVYAAWKGEWSDPRLFFAKFNGTSWDAQAQIPNVYSEYGPALGVVGTELVAAWKSAFDQSIHYAIFNGSNWSAQSAIPGVASSVGPSLAAVGNTLYAAWKGEDTDQGIYYAHYSGGVWSAQARIQNVATSVGPSLGVLGSTLYAIWKGENTDQGLYYAHFNGTSWSAQTQIAGVGTSMGAVLAGANGRLYAMWKGENADVKLWDAYYNGTSWSAQTNNIPGNTGPDSLGALVAAPGGRLGSNSNYILYNPGKNLTNVSATILITEEIASSNGFGFQLNCYSPNPQGDTCAWQQYSFVVENNTLSAVINNWPVDWYVNGNYVDLILEWVHLQSLSGNYLAAGYRLTVTLQNDASGNITGANFYVVDQHGTVQANVTKTLLSFNFPGFNSGDQKPINAFELDLVGPSGGSGATLTSGQGLFTLSATNPLTAANSEPAGDLAIGTAETANSVYNQLPAAYPNGEFWQLFSTSAITAPAATAGAHMMRRQPANVAAAVA